MELLLNKNNSPTLCLNMIVKNESKIITRLLIVIVYVIQVLLIIQ